MANSAARHPHQDRDKKMAKKSDAYYDEQEQRIYDEEIERQNRLGEFFSKRGTQAPSSGKPVELTESGGMVDDEEAEE